jgi:hypothetical protein
MGFPKPHTTSQQYQHHSHPVVWGMRHMPNMVTLLLPAHRRAGCRCRLLVSRCAAAFPPVNRTPTAAAAPCKSLTPRSGSAAAALTAAPAAAAAPCCHCCHCCRRLLPLLPPPGLLGDGGSVGTNRSACRSSRVRPPKPKHTQPTACC